MIRDVRIFKDQGEMSEAAAGFVAGAVESVVAERGRCSLALSGGLTPKGTYGLLAQRYGGKIPWPSLDLFWSDERCVPPWDRHSNFRMAREALLDHVPIPSDRIHRIQGLRPPGIAASAYEETLREHFGPASQHTFDLVLLGLGGDGHTASLFPGSPALHEVSRWVVAAEAPPGTSPPWRVTLTLVALNAARQALFLVSGEDKAQVARAVLSEDGASSGLPAARVRPGERLLWFLDRSAASMLET